MTWFFWTALSTALAAAACDPATPEAPPPPAPTSSSPQGAVRIHVPEKLSSIETGARDALGRPVRIACATCHSVKETARVPQTTADLSDFHSGMVFEHGNVSCISCHVIEPKAAPRLHLADGTQLAMTEAMRLCAQCHGPQFRDYQHGSHGGMTGHWDLSRGERVRNHCVDCHDPHAPKIPMTIPVLPPKDRRAEKPK